MYIPRHKYNAVRTEANGRTYDSKKEAEYAANLELKKRAGDVVFWLEQVPLKLPGGVVYRCDFQEFRSDGTVAFVEVKGFENQTWKVKKRLVESLYPIKIEVV